MVDHKKAWSLRTKLLATYLLVVGISMVMLFAVFETRNYRNAVSRLYSEIAQIADFQSSTLSVPVWNFDDQSINLAMSTLPSNPYFVSAVLMDDYGNVLESIGNVNFEVTNENLRVTRDIVYSGVDGLETVGKLVLTFDDEILTRQTTERLIIDGFMLVLLAGLLVGATFFSSQRIIGIPLDRLLTGIRRIKEKETNEPVEWTSGDEIGQVIFAFNDMMAHQYETDRQLRNARNAAVEAEARLKDAIENISEGFVLYDENQKLVLCNSRFKDFYRYENDQVAVGRDYDDLLRSDVNRGVVMMESQKAMDEYIAHRADYRRAVTESLEITLDDGRALLIRERPTQAGGRVGIQTDITEVKRVERELRNARDELEQRVEERTEELKVAVQEAETANRAKSEFLSRMSHELRTPLNGILGFAQLLVMDQKTPVNPKQREYVEHVLKAGHLLLELINEVLDLAKIESGRITLSLESVDPTMITNECLSMMGAYAEKHNVTLHSAVADGVAGPPPMVHGDFTRLKQVISNLLSNGVKYNRSGGSVTLQTGPGLPGYWRFAVIDTGDGIPEDRIRELFQPFNRLDAESSEIEGTGIGLTITQKLVTLMEGHIGVRSEIGKGSEFWVDIPLADPAVNLAARKTLDNPITINPKASNDGERDRVILYVEDNPANLKLMEEIISQLPHTVLVSAVTAEDGLALIDKACPDLILMDINLPGISGFEAKEKISDNPDWANIPVIAVTANAMPKEVARGEELGFISYLTKPIDVTTTLAEITRVLDTLEHAAAQ